MPWQFLEHLNNQCKESRNGTKKELMCMTATGTLKVNNLKPIEPRAVLCLDLIHEDLTVIIKREAIK